MRSLVLVLWLVISALGAAHAQNQAVFTRADTLRGTTTPQRAWWDVIFYDLHVTVSPSDKTIRGYNGITYRVLTPAPAQEMQIDLMPPLEVDSVLQDGHALTYRREGRTFFLTLAAPQEIGAQKTITVHYHGSKPLEDISKGFLWRRDSLGGAWIATSVQSRSMGASLWWPNKDVQADEPDSQRVAVTVPDSLVNVSNGRLRATTRHGNGTTTYEWFVKSPINNYSVALNIGRYTHFSDVFQSKGGKLTLDFWSLAYHADIAKKHFQQVKPVLQCFESWFGPYPWLQDGYKLVETPYLGMEHQSAIAYGNGYQNGYQGKDFYGTKLGLAWDYIIVHETAHEWFGNSITAKDPADNWVHESFATYAEGLYTECQFGKDSGAAYLVRARPKTNAPDWQATMVGPYGFAKQGESIYPKGAGMLHTIRQVVADDTKWRKILQGLNTTFRNRTVTGQQVVDYIATQSEQDLLPVFTRYLTVPGVPVLEYRITGSVLSYRWTDVVPGFAMPIKVTLADRVYSFIRPTSEWQTIGVRLSAPDAFSVDPNFFVVAKSVN